ncbi:MAG: ABC transporter permease [Crocinitomicaceae bacterium]|nr:ABC transporter permease [Crocinitomicaceae bacterium]
MIVKLAWKDIWRNKRRSMITMVAVAFAVFFAVLMRCMQLGMYDRMITTVVENKLGYIQVHQNGFWEEKIVDNAFFEEDVAIESIRKIKGVSIEKRIETGVLSSYGQNSKGSFVMSLEKSGAKTDLIKEQLIDGQLPQSGKNEVVIGSELAEFYGVKTGDTLVLIGQGYQGATAASLNVISGIANMKIPELNKLGIYMDLTDLQDFLSAPGALTSLIIDLDKPKNMMSVQEEIKQITGEAYEVMNWKELTPELVQMIQADSSGGLIMAFILYMIISFVMFGTSLMATQERKFEMGILLAIGMKKWRSIVLIFLESTFLNLFGVIVGLMGAIPIAFNYSVNPVPLKGLASESMEEMGFEAVIQFSADPSIFITHGLIILVISTLIVLYPVRVIAKMNPVEAMKR